MGYGYGPHWGGMGGGWGYGYGFGGPLHVIFWIVIIAVVIAGIVWLVRSFSAGGGQQITRRSPGLDVLEERYARGEIDREEYLQKKKDIGG